MIDTMVHHTHCSAEGPSDGTDIGILRRMRAAVDFLQPLACLQGTATTKVLGRQLQAQVFNGSLTWQRSEKLRNENGCLFMPYTWSNQTWTHKYRQHVVRYVPAFFPYLFLWVL